MPSGLFYLNSLDGSIFNRMGVWLVFIINHILMVISVYSANRIDPDQASNLGQHCLACLPISFMAH